MYDAELWEGGAYMTVFALGEAGAKVTDRAAVAWPESERQVQWLCVRTDHKYRAYSEACSDPDFCAALADRAGTGVISQEQWDGILDRMETLLWPVARTLAFALATPIWIDFDFADIKALFQSGKNAWIDTGSADRTDAADAVGAAGAINAGEAAGDAEGDNAAEASRDINAVNAAMDELFASSVFVKHVRAASGAFLHVTAPPDIGLAVIDQATSRVLEEVMDPEADVVWTANFEKTETDRVCITLIVIAGD